VSRLRHAHPTFRRSRFFNGRPVPDEDGTRVPDVVWLRPDAVRMRPEDWDSGFGRAIGMFLNGRGIREKDLRGRPVSDRNFLVYFNSGDDDVEVKLPHARHGERWEIVVDTAGEADASAPLDAESSVTMTEKSLLVLREVDTEETSTDDSVDASLRAQSEQPVPAEGAATA
jgi:glycogen operon protein